jgi:ParB family chromosome partitioning protein
MIPPRKPTLGRGLADLLGQAQLRPAVTAAGAGAAQPRPEGEDLAMLPLDLLQRGRYQPRVDMRNDALEELAASIRAQGVVQPIVVRPVGTPVSGEPQRYEIIAGERRWRAAQLAGLKTIPAVIRHVADNAAIAMALIENIQREDLNPLEEARALERLIAEFGLTHQLAADAVGRSRAAVSNLLRLLELAPEVCDRLERRELEMGHARALLGLENRRKQIELATLVVSKSLSVRETEALVRRISQPATPGATPPNQAPDPNIRRLQDDLTEKLGAKVTIEHARTGKGRVVVRYNSLDELDGILSHLR